MTAGPGAEERVRRWRHDLHRIPETAFEEHATAAYAAGVLEELGYDVVRGVGGTGVVASLTRGTSPRAVGLRAELDALPIEDVEDRVLRSQHPGRMHACGHDAHLAMTLGAAAALAEDTGGSGRGGTVRIVLQPAEEPGWGARAMVEDGLLDRFPLDALHGLHNLPGLPWGEVHTRPGPIMASEDDFEIVVEGRGGHSSAPHLVVDPLVVAAEIVLALQSVVARSVDPLRAAVLSCTDLRTDGARNALPGQVRITGDTRSFDASVQATLERRIRAVAEHVAAAHGATSRTAYTHEFAPTVNDAATTRRAVAAASAVLGAERVVGDTASVMASEDFGVLARHVPACFALLGTGTRPEAGGTPLHSRTYAFDDDVLPTGVAYLVAVARAELASTHA